MSVAPHVVEFMSCEGADHSSFWVEWYFWLVPTAQIDTMDINVLSSECDAASGTSSTAYGAGH